MLYAGRDRASLISSRICYRNVYGIFTFVLKPGIWKSRWYHLYVACKPAGCDLIENIMSRGLIQYKDSVLPVYEFLSWMWCHDRLLSSVWIPWLMEVEWDMWASSNQARGFLKITEAEPMRDVIISYKKQQPESGRLQDGGHFVPAPVYWTRAHFLCCFCTDRAMIAPWHSATDDSCQDITC